MPASFLSASFYESNSLKLLVTKYYLLKRKSHLSPNLLENKRLRPLCYFIELLVIFDEIWTTDFCVSELHPHNHLYVYTTGNCLFLVFSFTLRKQDMSLKVPKFKEFQVFFLWSSVTHSTCVDRVIEMHFPEFSLYSGSEKCCTLWWDYKKLTWCTLLCPCIEKDCIVF